MTPEINELLKKIATAKGITAVLIIVFLAIFVWRNLDFLTEVSFTMKKSDTKVESKNASSKQNNSGIPQLSLGEIILSPIPRKLPSFAVFEIKNPGSAPTTHIRVAINFGVAKVVAYEVIGPKQEDVKGSDPEQSVLNLDIAQLRPQESAYIYVQTSTPSFKKIALSSSDTTTVIEYTYRDFLESKDSSRPPAFTSYLFFLLGSFLLVMTIYFTVALIQKLNKWLNLKW